MSYKGSPCEKDYGVYILRLIFVIPIFCSSLKNLMEIWRLFLFGRVVWYISFIYIPCDDGVIILYVYQTLVWFSLTISIFCLRDNLNILSGVLQHIIISCV